LRSWPQASRRAAAESAPRATRHAGEVVIRLLILKHLFDWSYDDMEREVRANLVYRMFTRIVAGDVPDREDDPEDRTRTRPAGHRAAATRQVVEVAKRAGVSHGRRFRIDTTVVETNVHYPTTARCCEDGVRALTRTMRASTALGDPPDAFAIGCGACPGAC